MENQVAESAVAETILLKKGKNKHKMITYEKEILNRNSDTTKLKEKLKINKPIHNKTKTKNVMKELKMVCKERAISWKTFR